MLFVVYIYNKTSAINVERLVRSHVKRGADENACFSVTGKDGGGRGTRLEVIDGHAVGAGGEGHARRQRNRETQVRPAYDLKRACNLIGRLSAGPGKVRCPNALKQVVPRGGIEPPTP